jgi:hypothetical protein
MNRIMSVGIRCYWIVGLVSLMLTVPSYAQSMLGTRPKRGEVRWMNTYFGWPTQAWFKTSALLTSDLLAAAHHRPSDSLALVLLPDYHIELPSHKQYIRMYLLNPTAKKVSIERADATVMGLQIAIHLDDKWLFPKYLPESYCGNSFWQDTLAPKSYFTVDIDGDNFYQGTVPTECMVIAHVGQIVVKSPVFTAQLTPLQLYFLRYPRVPYPDID